MFRLWNTDTCTNPDSDSLDKLGTYGNTDTNSNSDSDTISISIPNTKLNSDSIHWTDRYI